MLVSYLNRSARYFVGNGSTQIPRQRGVFQGVVFTKMNLYGLKKDNKILSHLST